MPSPRPPQADALDLPELDKSDEADDVDVGTFELGLTSDDAETGEGAADTFEIDIQVLTDSGSNEAASDLDVGVSDMLDTLPDAPEARDSEPPRPATTDLDVHLDTPLESDEPSSDAELGDDGLEELPELLAEEGDGDAGPDVERAFLPSALEGEIPTGAPYEVDWLLLGTPCHALWAGSGSVLAAGEHVMTFGRERRSDALPAGTRVTSLVGLDGGGVVMATTRGLFERVSGGNWVTTEVPELTRGSAGNVEQLAVARAGQAMWARLARGALVRRRSGAWERHETGGEVRSLTCDQHNVTLLVLARRPTLQLSSDGGSSFRELLLPEPAATVAQGVAATAGSRGSVVALADAERGLCVSHDGGETFRMVPGAVNVTAITIGEHDGSAAVFAALHREGKDSTELVAVAPATAQAVCIANLAGEPDEDAEETGRTEALLFSEGYLWCAGGFGLAKLRA